MPSSPISFASTRVIPITAPLLATYAICPGLARNTSRGHHRSEEHTSELQSLRHLVCRLLLEKKNDHHTRALFGEALIHLALFHLSNTLLSVEDSRNEIHTLFFFY